MAQNTLNEDLPHTPLEVNITDELADAALSALFKYFEMQKESREKKSLFSEDENITVEFTLKRIFGNSNKLRLHRIALPHPIVEDPDPICLIVKSGFRNELKESLLNNSGIELIVTLDELPKEYKQFEDKRKLHNSYNKFICDESVQSLLPKLLGLGGSHWRKPIYPIKIGQKITQEAILQKIETVRSSTYWHFSEGTNVSVKLGNTGMTKQELVANLVHVVPEVIAHIPEGWDSVARLGIKTAASIYFPLFFAPTPEVPTEATTEEESKKPEEEEEEQKEEKKQNGKQKKRFFERVEEIPAEDSQNKVQPPAKQQKVAETKKDEPIQQKQAANKKAAPIPPPKVAETKKEEPAKQQKPANKKTAPAPPPKQQKVVEEESEEEDEEKEEEPVIKKQKQQVDNKKKVQTPPAKKEVPVANKKATPPKQVVQKEESEEDEDEEEEEQPTPAKKQAVSKKLTPVSKKDLLKQKLKSHSARKASNGSSNPKVRKTQTP